MTELSSFATILKGSYKRGKRTQADVEKLLNAGKITEDESRDIIEETS